MKPTIGKGHASPWRRQSPFSPTLGPWPWGKRVLNNTWVLNMPTKLQALPPHKNINPVLGWNLDTFTFFNVPWITHLLHFTKYKYCFQGSLQTLCSSVKQSVIKYWWYKFPYGRDVTPGTSKRHFKTEILTYFLKVLCTSPPAHKDSCYICVTILILKTWSRTWYSALKTSLRIWHVEKKYM